MDKPQIIKELGEIQYQVSELHRKGEGPDRDREIESAYKELGRVINTLEDL